MGCDIHCYIEFKSTEQSQRHKWKIYDKDLRDAEPESKGMPEFNYHPQRQWSSFGEDINPGRNYRIFGKLAGIRWSDNQIIPLRGYPPDAGYYAERDNWYRVVADKDYNDDKGICSETQADKYISYGCICKVIHTSKYVSSPDWHSHSWCSTDELEQVLVDEPLEVEYFAILAAMREFEKFDYNSRLVFWFDN